jgi:hypothetical protein
MRWIIAAAVVAMIGLSAVLADIAPRPRPKPQPEPAANAQANFVIEVDPNATEAKLQVPNNIVVRNAGLDVPADGTLTGGDEPKSTPYGTMIAGASLAMAITCAGLWLVRRGKTNGKALGWMIAGSVIVGGAAMAWANVAPPARPPQKAEVVNQFKVKVERVADGDTVKLIVPPAIAKGFAPVNAPPTNSGNAPPKSGSAPPTPDKPE